MRIAGAANLDRSRSPWWVAPTIAIVMVAAFAYFVWPTPWKYPDDGRYARRHRVAQRYEILIDLGDGTTGWATHVVDEDTGVRTLLDPDVGGP